jgi:REP element-mobilizing transposase RayT
MPHSYTHLLSHVIFSTKDRAPTLDADLRSRLYSYMGDIMREIGGSALNINGTPDHVHLLLLLPGTTSMADAMRVLKTNSSRWIHETYPNRRTFAWQTGYGAFSVSQSNAEEVRRYIDNQEEHHRKVTFEEEFVAFLKRHGVEYDERYIWQ